MHAETLLLSRHFSELKWFLLWTTEPWYTGRSGSPHCTQGVQQGKGALSMQWWWADLLAQGVQQTRVSHHLHLWENVLSFNICESLIYSKCWLWVGVWGGRQFSLYMCPPCFCEMFLIFCVANQYMSKFFQKVIYQGMAQLKYCRRF